MKNKTKIVGIAGGTGSGKTYLTNQLKKRFDSDSFEIIELDAYYKDLSHLSFEKREKTNFDHPTSFDFELLIKHLENLEEKNKINIPIYNYKTHTRMIKTKLIYKKKLLIIEGIFSFFNKNLRDKMIYKVFLNISEKTRLERRLKRDTIDRARTIESINKQLNNTVIPMHKKYVQPSIEFADLVIENKDYKKKEDILYKKIERILNDRQ